MNRSLLYVKYINYTSTEARQYSNNQSSKEGSKVNFQKKWRMLHDLISV